jgi:uncharacterized membrane protein
MSERTIERIEKETARVEAFSDGVFAIAITLLILEIKVPHEAGHDLWRRLLEEWPSYFAFVTSFATIGIMWMNHHRMFNLIARIDSRLLIFNGVLLLGVTFIPYPTAVVAAYLGRDGAKAAAAFLAIAYILIAIAFNVLWRYVSSAQRKPHLLRVPPEDPQVQAIRAAYRFGPLYYFVTLLAALWDARVSVGLNLALAVYWAKPPREEK